MNLTVLVITKNAGDTLRRTLESVLDLHCSILIIDDYSLDATKQIAREFEAKVVLHSESNFGKQRAFALTQVHTKWTFVLDSDEVLTEDNLSEITKAIQSESHTGYYMKFRNHLSGRKLLHGELHKKLVLFQTKEAFIDSSEIHEQYKVNGIVGNLASEVSHFSYRSVSQIIRKFFDYSLRQARVYKREGKKYGLKELLLNPLHMFYARSIKDEGYKDGPARLFLDYQFAQMEFLSYFLIPFVKIRKRIGVDCGSYTINGSVRSGIDRLIQGIYSNATDEANFYWFSFSQNSKNKLPTFLFSEVWLPLAVLFNQCDAFLGLSGSVPRLLSFFPIKKILFIYDFGFYVHPEKYGTKALKLQKQTEDSIRRAGSIVVLHEEIYKEFLSRFPIYAHKVSLLSSGADHLLTIKEIPVFVQPKKPFILSVGVVKPVKRIEKIISAVGNMYCVIAGSQEKEYTESLKIGKLQHIQFIQNFNDGQLKWLYTHADVMVYASAQEGFCYPVLEALILGLPVIAYNLPIFKTYQRYFPHLLLVDTEEEMVRSLRVLPPRDLKGRALGHPYKWETFNTQLCALWQTRKLPWPNNSKKYAFIVVLYKTSIEEKERLKREIENIKFPAFEIYWIDNSSNGKGYAAGVNEGIRKGLIDARTDFIVLNPDISLTGIATEKIRAVSAQFGVWGFAMRQNGKVYYGGEIDKWRMSGGLVQVKPHVRYAPVDFVSGSVIGFSSEVVQKIGLWDESYFMYYEDVDFCIRARKAGFEVGIDSDTEYDHFEVSQRNKKKEMWIAQSRWKFFWKYANVLQKMREIVRLPKTRLFKN